MTPEEKYKILSNNYTDLFIVYNRNENLLNQFPNSTTHIINTPHCNRICPCRYSNKKFYWYV